MSTFERKILIVEDEDVLRETIVKLVRENHSDVGEARNGEEGIELLKRAEYSLVLTDIKMPVLCGLKMFTKAKELSIKCPFVFLTAFGDQENTAKALRLGAFDFINKPFDNDELMEVVNRGVEVGFRRNLLRKSIEASDEVALKTKSQCEKVINLLELYNHKKRS